MSLIYRTNGPWGIGLGSDLPAADVDNNFWTLWQLYVALQATAATAEIDFFSISGTSLYVHLTDHTVLGPYTLPTWMPIPVGEWQPLTNYVASDEFYYNGAAYLVNINHTSQSSFNPNYQIGGLNVYSAPILVSPGNVLPLGGEQGQSLTVVHGGGGFGVPTVDWEYIIPSGGTAGNVLTLVTPGTGTTPAVVDWESAGGSISLEDLSDVVITSPAVNDTLSWGGSNWINQQPALAFCDDVSLGTVNPENPNNVLLFNGSFWINSYLNIWQLGDCAVSSPADPNQVLMWDGSFWINSFIDVEQLGNVVTAGLTTGQVLTYNSIGNSWVNTTLIIPTTTVSGLGGAPAAGIRSFVTDSTVVAAGNFGAVVAGSGSHGVPVYSDGTSWRIG